MSEDQQTRQVSDHIFTNRGDNTLIKEFEGVLESNPQIKNLDAVVGFLRASGYFSLQKFLGSIDRVRVLIGMDVDKYIAEAARRGQLFLGAEEGVKGDCLCQIRRDIESSDYKKEVEEGVLQMVQDIGDGKLELRAHPSKNIHAKIYVLYPNGFDELPRAMGMAITGSSNLTGNGLGISAKRQYEFNVKMPQGEDVRYAKNEFEQLWEEARGCVIAADDLKETIDQTYLKGDVSPYDLYIRMLMEYFSDRLLATEKADPFDMPVGYTKYDYQMDAVIEGYQKLLRYNGFFLADVVGLGKTVVATMIAKKFLIENGITQTKILVVYPPAVEQNWKATFKDFGIDKYTNFVSNGSLSKVLDENNCDYWNADEYDLVLVDEAHKFRNHTTLGYTQLQEICKMPRVETGNIPGYRKKVMLISATPMNNMPADLYNQILLFQDSRRCTIDGVGNLTSFFSPLIIEFDKLRRDSKVEEIKQLAEKVRNRIVKPITVRRTRTDIESVPRYSEDVSGFPKVERPVENRYELNEATATLFEDTMKALCGEEFESLEESKEECAKGALTYARYRAIAYLKKELAEDLYDNADLASYNLAAIRKTGLVKRLESSFAAFKISINRFRKANQNMIRLYWEVGKVFIAPDLNINAMWDQGMSDAEIEERVLEKNKLNPKNDVFSSDDFGDEFITLLEADQEILDGMCEAWSRISDDDDTKFAKFKELLECQLLKPDINKEGKLVVFSESVDTIEYLARRIEPQRSDVLVISSENRERLFKTIRENFDANYSDRHDEYNIILTTDALAEGINLHRANVIVNYDVPWNSTRLIQRIGRVNRIGAQSKHIYNYVFYPSREGNQELHLNQIAISKIQHFHSVYGEDNQFYSRSEILDHSPIKLFSAAMEEQTKDFNQEIPYYEELRTLYKTDRREYNRIAKLSLRSRTGRGPRSVDGVSLSGDTLVFLKTNFRKVFFLVSESAEEISVLDAMKYFKAAIDEKPVERINEHYQHVEKALMKFRTMQVAEVREEETARDGRGSPGAQLRVAVSLLNSFMDEEDDEGVRLKLGQLKKLVERGVISSLAPQLQKIFNKLRSKNDKARMSRAEARQKIVGMADKYAPRFAAEEGLRGERESEAEVILSESFQPYK